MTSGRSEKAEHVARIPEAVAHVGQFLAERGVWYQLSRNSKGSAVYSCQQAAALRMRLGRQGIPMHDELRSYLCEYEVCHKTHYVCAHCRGDRSISMAAVGAAIGSKAEVHLADAGVVGLSKGLINPFVCEMLAQGPTAFASGQCLQVFDSELMAAIGVPGTCMTNAGDLRWGIEFGCADVVRVLPGSIIAPIAMKRGGAPRIQMRKLGIITGDPPEAGTYVVEMICNILRARLLSEGTGQIGLPPFYVLSIPDLLLAVDLNGYRAGLLAALKRAVTILCTADCTIIGLPSNAASAFSGEVKELAEAFGVEFVSLPSSCRRELDRCRISSCAVLGISLVGDVQSEFSPYRDVLASFDVEVLSEDAIRMVEKLADSVRRHGYHDGGAIKDLRHLVNDVVRCETVVLASSELSLLYRASRGTGFSRRIVCPLVSYSSDLAERLVILDAPIRFR